MNTLSFYIGKQIYEFDTELGISENIICDETLLNHEVAQKMKESSLKGIPQNIKIKDETGTTIMKCNDLTTIGSLIEYNNSSLEKTNEVK